MLTLGTETQLIKGRKKSSHKLKIVEKTSTPPPWSRKKLHGALKASNDKVICLIVQQAIVSHYKLRWLKRRHSRVAVTPGHVHKTLLQTL